MPRITEIPESYYGGFVKLNALDDLSFELLKNALQRSELALGTSKLVAGLGPVGNLESSLVRDILVSVSSVMVYSAQIEASIEETVDDLCSILRSKKKDVDFSIPESEERFKSRLTALFENEQLYYSSKAAGLTSSYENIYHSAKIITDIRPVFGAEVTNQPKACLTVHILKIHYFNGDELDHKDIYIAMDAKDIKSLQAVLSRAEKKENTLRTLVDEAGMKDLSPREEN